MMKVLILGGTGMLGSEMINYFLKKKFFDVFYTTREKQKSEKELYFNVDNFTDLDFLTSFDYVINCIGTTKPFIEVDPIKSIFINSIFPRKISNFCEKNNIKLIHITTDCVFSGKHGNYNEDSPHDCEDLYGKSKSIGEPKNCMCLRTSIIGKEINHFVHLVSWAISQKDNNVNGFSNHLWNGVTTKYLSEIIHSIIQNSLFDINLYHIFSPNSVSKFDLLNILNVELNLNLKIKKIIAEPAIDRTLSSKYDFSKNLSTLSIADQIKDI